MVNESRILSLFAELRGLFVSLLTGNDCGRKAVIPGTSPEEFFEADNSTQPPLGQFAIYSICDFTDSCVRFWEFLSYPSTSGNSEGIKKPAGKG